MKVEYNNLNSEWQAVIEKRLSSDSTRCWYFDVDQDGTLELCLQADEDFLLIKDRNIMHCSEKLFIPLNSHDEDGSVSFVEARGSSLQFFCNGEVCWVMNFARKKFGVGIGRDNHGDLGGWDSEYLGIYREKVTIVGLELMDWNHDGVKEILVMMSNGRLVILSQKGEIINRIQLKKGHVNQVRFFPEIDPETGNTLALLVSIYFQSILKYGFINAVDFEWYTFVIQNRRVTDVKKEVAIIGKVPNQNGHFITTGNAEVNYRDGRLIVKGDEDANCVLARITGGRQNLQDPFDPSRFLLCECDTTQQTVTLKTANGNELWQYDLPSTTDSDYRIRGCLGRDAVSGETLIVISFDTQQIIPEYNSKVRENYICVFSEEGELRASVVFPPNGDSDFITNRILILSAKDGKNELIVIDNNIIQAYSLNGSNRDTQTILPKHEVWTTLSEYPKPAKNIWNLEVVKGDLDN